MGVMRAARQEKEKVKVGMKEREEEGNLLLRKMQERLKVIAEYSRKQNHMKCSFTLFLQELKMALGGRVKHLEVELAKSERAREELRGKKEAEMLQVRYEKCSKCENHNFKKNLFSCH